jgi:hypothetical protein
MGLAENLVKAESAIQWVRNTCGLRADNYDQPDFQKELAPEGERAKTTDLHMKLHAELGQKMMARFDEIQAPERKEIEEQLKLAEENRTKIQELFKTEKATQELIKKNQDANKLVATLVDKKKALDKERNGSFGGMGEQIRSRALAAIHRKVGNCMEQAAIAFCYLQREGVRPLDYYYAMGGDHQWVVIGRTKGSSQDNPDLWGGDAVICDPWDKKAYAATEFDNKMHQLGQNGVPASEFRID